MKLLWISPNFLHPTTKGGQIRTLGILSRLSREHEIHYVAFEDPKNPEGPARAGEYSYRAYPFPHALVDKRSPRFAAELAAGLFSPLPLAIRRFRSAPLAHFLEDLIERERFDRVVADFLVMAASCPDPGRAFLFQHNVETMIWRRHAEHAGIRCASCTWARRRGACSSLSAPPAARPRMSSPSPGPTRA